MRQLWKWMPVVLVLVLAVGTAFTADPAAIRDPKETPATTLTAEELAIARAKIRARSPLMVEIDALLAKQRAALLTLESELAVATDLAHSIALQRKIAEVKEQTEIDILDVQLTHARDKGNQALVQELERSIELLKSPPSPIEPQAREPRAQAPAASGH
jgi:hypothetical protein